MAIQELKHCDCCDSVITAGQRWVRQKIYNPVASEAPRYRHYHAEPDFAGGESCWERHQLQHLPALTAAQSEVPHEPGRCD